MKSNTHPQYKTIKVTCACGETFLTGTTKNIESLRVDVCNKCHPYFTGKQKLVETGGRIDKFNKRYNRG
ncbi:MAG: 50S ribosomal protein L31 [Clostridia bacterium]|nr:50S ribosomal protein L31 [Clostridia bacterium]